MSKEDINNKRLSEQKIREENVSVYAYDLALVEDLRARFKREDGNQIVNDTVQIGSPDNMFDILGTLNDDQVVMPFIGLQRVDWQLNMDRQGFQTFIGEQVYEKISPVDNLPVEVRAQVIPITINYRLTVWSVDRITNDALVRELLWYYHLRPSLMVYVGHGLNIAHKFNIYFNSGIEDNSDIANHKNGGTYFRQDMTLYTDDAYLWKARHDEKVAIEPDLYFDYGVDVPEQSIRPII